MWFVGGLFPLLFNPNPPITVFAVNLLTLTFSLPFPASLSPLFLSSHWMNLSCSPSPLFSMPFHSIDLELFEANVRSVCDDRGSGRFLVSALRLCLDGFAFIHHVYILVAALTQSHIITLVCCFCLVIVVNLSLLNWSCKVNWMSSPSTDHLAPATKCNSISILFFVGRHGHRLWLMWNTEPPVVDFNLTEEVLQ